MSKNGGKKLRLTNFAYKQQNAIHMNDGITINRNLKALREANNLTQEQVAAYLGIGRSAYANYETGERETPVCLLEKACALFGCEADLLFSQDVDVAKDALVCNFNCPHLNEHDVREVAAFKDIVLSYMKMERLLTTKTQ